MLFQSPRTSYALFTKLTFGAVIPVFTVEALTHKTPQPVFGVVKAGKMNEPPLLTSMN